MIVRERAGTWPALLKAASASLGTGWDVGQTTRRQDDKTTAMAPAKPLSSHVDDPTLRPFLDPAFDHVDYLNALLPAVSLPTASHSSHRRSGSSLTESAAQTQAIVSQLSTSTSRLSETLTTLTDDIIRASSRLAYEVEVLRGEAVGLSETLHDTLADDIKRFWPEAFQEDGAKAVEAEAPLDFNGHGGDEHVSQQLPDTRVPPSLDQLQTLATVKDRLESVVKVFGQAMEWVLPPSERSVASSFISVSSPDVQSDVQDREAKGQAFATRMRAEMATLVATGPAGQEEARRRVKELRRLANVWKGTAEEKARIRLVESLAKLVEDKQRASKQ